MKVSDKILTIISQLKEDAVFDYTQLNIDKAEYNAAAKALERLCKKETIQRISKGVFYKPKQSVFGILPPKNSDILNRYLFKGGKRIAYITGTNLYNKIGLTTQIAAIYNIASTNKRISINVGGLRAKSVKSYVEVTEDNYQTLGLLDAFKDFNNIPDLNRAVALQVLTNELDDMPTERLNRMVRDALSYPSRVRALLGAILEQLNKEDVRVLKDSLNPLSTYKYHIEKGLLSNQESWNLV